VGRSQTRTGSDSDHQRVQEPLYADKLATAITSPETWRFPAVTQGIERPISRCEIRRTATVRSHPHRARHRESVAASQTDSIRTRLKTYRQEVS